MENKVCFLFGHSFADSRLLTDIQAAAERHYLQLGIRTFIVGARGGFDRTAAEALVLLKRRYPDITLTELLAYHPAERPEPLIPGFDGSFYPPLEGVPRQYAILRANQYMADTADSIICYASHVGNARKLLHYARRRTELPIDNLDSP